MARMNITEILSSIDAEIANLEQVRTVLTGIGNGTRAKKGANGRRKKRAPLSRAARERIAAAQRKRWAKQKRAAK
jgi:hypothetical protein